MYDIDGTPLQGLTGGPVDRRVEFVIPKTWRTSQEATGKAIVFYIEVGMNGMFGNGLALPSAPPKQDRIFKVKLIENSSPSLFIAIHHSFHLAVQF